MGTFKNLKNVREFTQAELGALFYFSIMIATSDNFLHLKEEILLGERFAEIWLEKFRFLGHSPK